MPAGRPALPPEQRRAPRMVRMSDAEWEALQRAAEAEGCSSAAVVRAALAERLGDDWPCGGD